MFTSEELERLYEVMAEAKEAIILSKTALKNKSVDERELENFEEVEPTEDNVLHIMPQTIVNFNVLQQKSLRLVPDISDLLSKLSEDLCFVVIMNRKHLRNQRIRKHIEELLTITVMVAKILQEEIGRRTSGTSGPGPVGA